MKCDLKVAASLILLVACFSVAQSALAQEIDSGSLLDLTHSFDEKTIYWPTEEGFKLLRGPAGVTERGYYYSANRFTCAEHGGTHIDAPRHFWETGQTVDEIPLKRLIARGALVDVSAHCQSDRDYQITVEDLKAWESAANASLEDRIVMLYTGFGRFWPDRQKYLGTDEEGRAAVADLHFPGLHSSAAEWLAAKRRVRAVGIDTASIDYGQSRDFPTHVMLFKNNVPALENVAHLDQLPLEGFTVLALPMKIADGSGGPCRVVAILDE